MSDIAALRARAKADHHLPAMIAEVVDLQPTPSGLRGACTFHPDASRGLYVLERFYFCFSCGTGGDVVHWWMRHHTVDEATAILQLTEHVPPNDDASSNGQAGAA